MASKLRGWTSIQFAPAAKKDATRTHTLLKSARYLRTLVTGRDGPVPSGSLPRDIAWGSLAAAVRLAFSLATISASHRQAASSCLPRCQLTRNCTP